MSENGVRQLAMLRKYLESRLKKSTPKKDKTTINCMEIPASSTAAQKETTARQNQAVTQSNSPAIQNAPKIKLTKCTVKFFHELVHESDSSTSCSVTSCSVHFPSHK